MRVAKAYGELFGGYFEDPAAELGRTFEEVAGYDDMVLIKDISFHSHCEHHMVPIIGKAHVAYLPDGKVVGLSKIARVVDIFARRLQTQETMTAQISGCIQDVLQPRGVAVMHGGRAHVHGHARHQAAGFKNLDNFLYRRVQGQSC